LNTTPTGENRRFAGASHVGHTTSARSDIARTTSNT